MNKRYHETIEMLAVRPDRRSGQAPAAFRWRGRICHVVNVVGFWSEDAGHWINVGMDIPQRDLWRVETDAPWSLCELIHEGERWLLARVWD